MYSSVLEAILYPYLLLFVAVRFWFRAGFFELAEVHEITPAIKSGPEMLVGLKLTAGDSYVAAARLAFAVYKTPAALFALQGRRYLCR
jgi:hypothetical protein